MSGVPKEKIDHLIFNYFIQEGFQEAAISFAKEANINLVQNNIISGSKNSSFLNQLSRLSSSPDEEFYGAAEDLGDQESLKYLPKQESQNSNVTAGYSTINQRTEIKVLILKGEITLAIQKISEHFPTVLDSNNLLHFKLLKLNLIEMIRNHKLTTSNDNENERNFLNCTLSFVRENLINKVTNSYKLLKELEITMSLLCFNFDPTVKKIEEQKDLPDELRSLFDLSLRHQCYRLVNRAILDLDDDEVINGGFGKQKIYRGFGFIEFDFRKMNQSNNMDSLGNIEIDMLDGEDYEIDKLNEEGKYTHQLTLIVQSQDNFPKDNDKVDDIAKLQNLSLESKLERAVKLWTVTEQRLIDLKIIKEKRFQLNDENL